MEDTYILEMSHIVKTFPGVRALGDGCLRLKKGEIHALIRGKRCGKIHSDENPVGRLPGRLRRDPL